MNIPFYAEIYLCYFSFELDPSNFVAFQLWSSKLKVFCFVFNLGSVNGLRKEARPILNAKSDSFITRCWKHSLMLTWILNVMIVFFHVIYLFGYIYAHKIENKMQFVCLE